MKNNIEKNISLIKSEVNKIDKKKNNIFFFVFDTEGIANGCLEYIYKLAKILADDKYKVTMLYQKAQDKDFFGVKSWMGDEYASLPHSDVNDDENKVKIAASDIMFIPEMFAGIMSQTKNLPCKRIALFTNYTYMTEQTAFGAQWGNFGIMDAVAITEKHKEILGNIFPYVKTDVINPFIEKFYGTTDEPKKLVVNIISKDPNNINKIIKPFYWMHPSLKWISFRDIRTFTTEKYSEALREAAITVWVDDDAEFGYCPIEAARSGSIVIAKIPNEPLEWMLETDKDGNKKLKSSCIWVDNWLNIPNLIANVVEAWMTDLIPSELYDNSLKLGDEYTKENTSAQLLSYIQETNKKRKEELEKLIVELTEKEKSSDNNKQTTKDE